MDLEPAGIKPPTRLAPDASEAEHGSPVGRFEWNPGSDHWWWSDGLYRLYGYEPRSVEPTMERFVQHKDPQDRARIDAVFARALSQGGPFSCYHRIFDVRGRRRTVVVVGYGDRNLEDTHTVCMHGFMVDVTAAGREETNAALEATLQTRAGIEQVKGALMVVHRLSADAAFEVLRGHSQVYNKKLSSIVAEVLAAIGRRDGSEEISRAGLDRLLWDASH